MIKKRSLLLGEERRLRFGLEPDESSGWRLKVLFIAHCPGNAESVLNKVKTVLRLVLRTMLEGGKNKERGEWEAILPDWFVSKCLPERSQEEADKWHAWWRHQSQEKRDEMYKEGAKGDWSLLNWLYWFDSETEARDWLWWDASIKDTKTIHLEVIVDGDTCLSDALSWLFRASGAESFEEVLD